jgi:hypothetical protein
MENKKAGLFYFAVKNERKGPFSTSEIPALLEKGDVSPDTLVWAEGMSDWLALRDAFKEFLPTPPPLPVQTAAPLNKSQGHRTVTQNTAAKAGTCKVCGGLVAPNAKACECCGANPSAEASPENKCPDCTTATHVGQWFCVECHCPLAVDDKKFLKVLEKHAYKMNNALGDLPDCVREIVETGDETLEYRFGDRLLTNKRIFRYGSQVTVTHQDPNDEHRTTNQFLFGGGGAVLFAIIAGVLSGGDGGGIFVGIIVGLVIGLSAAGYRNTRLYGESKTKTKREYGINESVNLEDITTTPDAQSKHTSGGYIGNIYIEGSDSYWVEFDSLKGHVKYDMVDFDSALTLAGRIRDAADALSSETPSTFHTLSMVHRRMKAKGISVSSTDDIAA